MELKENTHGSSHLFSITEQFHLGPKFASPTPQNQNTAVNRLILPGVEFCEHLSLNYPRVRLFPPHPHHKQFIKEFLSLPSCVTLGKLLNLSVPDATHLLNSNINST